MQRSLAALAALLLAARSTVATDGLNRNLAKIPGPFMNKTSPYFTVLFTGFMIGDQKSTMKALKTVDGKPAAMNDNVFGNPDLPVLQADYDTATVTVTMNATTPAKNAVSTSVYACYAKSSLYDRGWRKPNNNTELDKQCPWLIKKGMPVEGGTVQWTPQADIPKAIMFLRAYQLCSVEGSEEDVICAFGNSPGVVQVNPIQTHPANLVGAAIACLFAGPLCLVGWFVYETKAKKHH